MGKEPLSRTVVAMQGGSLNDEQRSEGKTGHQ